MSFRTLQEPPFWKPCGISENPYNSVEDFVEFSGKDINSSVSVISTINMKREVSIMAEVRQAEIKQLGINQVKADPNQPRKTFKNLSGLAETISRHGLIQPIEVDESCQIIVGERRWRAARLAGLAEIPALVKPGLTDAEKLEHQLIEDMQDEAIHPLERARAWLRLKTMKGLTNLELSKTLGLSERHVYRVLSLNNMLYVMAKALEEGKISATELMDIRGLPIKEQLLAFKKAIESSGEKFVRDRLNSMRGRANGRFLDIKARDFLRELGAKVDSVNRNAVVSHQGERMKHFVVKAMIYKILREHGRATGCEMEINSAQADVVDLSSSHVYEVENDASPMHVKKKLEQFRAMKDVFIIELAKLPDSLKEMEAYLRERVL